MALLGLFEHVLLLLLGDHDLIEVNLAVQEIVVLQSFVRL